MEEHYEHIDYHDLIIRYLAREANQEEIRLLEQWVKKDPSHAAAFRQYRQGWILARLRQQDDRIDVDKEWQAISSRLFPEEKGSSRVTPLYRKYRSARVWRIAAAFLLLVAAAFLVVYLTSPPQDREYSTGDTINTISLPDGTEATLNIHTMLTCSRHYNKHTREVSLDGAAFFDVTSDPARTFIIRTNDLAIRVTGTSFYVNARKEDPEIEVTVSEGQVILRAQDQLEIVVDAGKKGTFSRVTGELFKGENTDPNFISWKTKYLVFSGDRLEDVIDKLNDTYFSHIQIASPGMKGCRLTATFDNQSLETVLEVIGETFGLNVQVEDERIVLSGEGCE